MLKCVLRLTVTVDFTNLCQALVCLLFLFYFFITLTFTFLSDSRLPPMVRLIHNRILNMPSLYNLRWKYTVACTLLSDIQVLFLISETAGPLVLIC